MRIIASAIDGTLAHASGLRSLYRATSDIDHSTDGRRFLAVIYLPREILLTTTINGMLNETRSFQTLSYVSTVI